MLTTNNLFKTVKITSKNMIVLPKLVRERFHLQEGERLKVTINEDKIILSPFLSICKLEGILKGKRSAKELLE